MILDTTYNQKEKKQIVNDLVGKPFSFIEVIKFRSVISKRLIIKEVSPNLRRRMNIALDFNFANIELRSGGILIHINKEQELYIWAIPYRQLAVNKINGLSIHAQGRYIHFGNDKSFQKNRVFFSKLLNEKIKYEFNHDFHNR